MQNAPRPASAPRVTQQTRTTPDLMRAASVRLRSKHLVKTVLYDAALRYVYRLLRRAAARKSAKHTYAEKQNRTFNIEAVFWIMAATGRVVRSTGCAVAVPRTESDGVAFPGLAISSPSQPLAELRRP